MKYKIYIKNTLKVILTIIFIILALYLVILGYAHDWTGFGSSISPPIPQDHTFRPTKTLWDWMNLLIVPIVLAIAAYLFNRSERRLEFQIANQRTQDEALKDYIDHMTKLLLEENLRHSEHGAEVRIVARVRTLTLLKLIDGIRKGIVLRFLAEAGLLGTDEKPSGIIDLRGADLSLVKFSIVTHWDTIDLSGLDLAFTNLSEADLSGAYLIGTNFDAANMRKANLNKATLAKAILAGVDLRGANLREADLRDAILSTADLRETKLDNVNLAGAIEQGTKWPKNFRPKNTILQS